LSRTRAIVALFLLAWCARVEAQGAASAAASRKWEIVDNSFLVEEAFNQEAGVFQNIFTWVLSRHGAWAGNFTQEWPLPNTRHQFSSVVLDESFTLSPGFRRGWNFGERQFVIGIAAPITRSEGRSTTALLTYLSYELPFR
jgi:hypothetical protein